MHVISFSFHHTEVDGILSDIPVANQGREEGYNDYARDMMKRKMFIIRY